MASPLAQLIRIARPLAVEPSSRLRARADLSPAARLERGDPRFSRGETRGRHRFLALALAALAASGCVEREGYPHRPIVLLCPWAAGGGTDRFSRRIAVYLEQELGVPVSVVNATGGAGVTGHSRGARARPDGYTLTMMTVELDMLHWRGLTRVRPDDFTPIGLVNRESAALFVRRDAPWSDLRALAAAARDAPGRLTASGTATGGIWHLALAGWLDAAGLPASAIRWVPSGGAGPSLQELMSAGVDVVCCSLPEARSLLRAGRVRALGVMADEPVPAYPDAPTFRSLGFHWSIAGWRGVGAPRATPPAVTARLAAVLERIVTGACSVGGETFPQAMESEGANVTWEPPAQFARSLARADEALGKLLTSPAFGSLEETPVGPMVFPSLLALGLLLAGAGLLLGQKRRPRPGSEASEPGGDESAGEGERGTGNESVGGGGAAPGETAAAAGRWRFASVVLAVVFYILAAETMGFLLAGGIVLFALSSAFGTRPRVALLLTALLTPLVWELFAGLLRVPLPLGFWGW